MVYGRSSSGGGCAGTSLGSTFVFRGLRPSDVADTLIRTDVSRRFLGRRRGRYSPDTIIFVGRGLRAPGVWIILAAMSEQNETRCCPRCQAEVKGSPAAFAALVACPACKQKVAFPPPFAVAVISQEPDRERRYCPRCSQLVTGTRRALSKPRECPGCGSVVEFKRQKIVEAALVEPATSPPARRVPPQQGFSLRRGLFVGGVFGFCLFVVVYVGFLSLFEAGREQLGKALEEHKELTQPPYIPPVKTAADRLDLPPLPEGTALEFRVVKVRGRGTNAYQPGSQSKKAPAFVRIEGRTVAAPGTTVSYVVAGIQNTRGKFEVSGVVAENGLLNSGPIGSLLGGLYDGRYEARVRCEGREKVCEFEIEGSGKYRNVGSYYSGFVSDWRDGVASTHKQTLILEGL